MLIRKLVLFLFYNFLGFSEWIWSSRST